MPLRNNQRYSGGVRERRAGSRARQFTDAKTHIQSERGCSCVANTRRTSLQYLPDHSTASRTLGRRAALLARD